MTGAPQTPVSRDTADHYVWGQVCDGWHLLARQDLHVIHERMPPGAAETAHSHAVARQFFFVLSGQLTMRFCGADVVVDPQAGLEIPPDAIHQARNEGDAPVEFLVISHPSTRSDRTDG